MHDFIGDQVPALYHLPPLLPAARRLSSAAPPAAASVGSTSSIIFEEYGWGCSHP